MLPRLFICLCMLTVTAMASAQTRPLVPVDQEISQAEALRLVDPQLPGLEGFAAALQANDLPRAQGLLVRHFATRTQPVIPPAQAPGISEGNSTCVLGKTSPEQAAQWLKHVFTESNNDLGKQETYDLGADIQWLKNPSGGLSWMLYVNQLNHLNSLAGLYRENKDEKLAVEVGESVRRWSQQVPAWYGYTNKGEITPSGMEVRNRLSNLLAAYDVVRASPSLTPEMHLAFWKVFIASARELMKYDGVSYPGLIYAAVLLPEFTEAKTWLKSGEANLRFALINRTSPEGAWDTQSISYQTVPVPWSLRCLEFLQANPESGDFTAMAGMVKAQVGKLLELMLRLAMPNGALPNVGDTYGRPDWSDGHTRQLLISFIHSQMTPEQQAKLNAIADPYARLQAALAMGEGATGPAPTRCSQTFPGSGYTVMRSGWEPDEARYLYFDLTPQGMGHAHNDAGHFDLYGYGKPLLADTGDYFLGWGYRAALHNTIEVDGRDQARGAARAPMLPCDWASSAGFDLVEGAQGAYGDLGVIHRRKMIFVKSVGEAPDYFVLCDRLTGEGSHVSEQFFHFAGPTQTQAATVQLDPQSLVARSTEANAANVQVIPTATEGLKAQMAAAQDTDMKPEAKFERAAMLGWMVTGGCFQRVKAPVVAYRREGPLPQSYADVLFPVAAGATAEVQVASLPVAEGGKTVTAHEALGLQVDWRITRPKHAADELTPKLGANLALGKPGFAEVSQGQIAPTSALLTDGDLAPEKIGGALSSGPYAPGVLLTGRFTVDLGQETEVSAVVLHHGTWNGSTTLYAAEKLSIQVWDGQAWRDAPNQRTEWRAGSVSQTVFDPVRSTRLSVAVERASGGRIALREFEAYRIPEAEVQRVAAMARETVAQSGSDLILISHTGAATRTYGPVTLDGEMAIVRRDAGGKTLRLAVREATSLTGAGPAYRWPDRAPCWTGQTPPPAGPPARAPLVISDLRVQMQPAQEGFAAAQPSAVITWTTSRPCRSQVCFQEEGVGLRRTPLSDRLDTRHSVTAWFLRPDQPYEFQAVAIGEDGARATATVKP